MKQIPLITLFGLVLASLSACDSDQKSSRKAAVNNIDACSLLTQQEIDGLFDHPIGSGKLDSPNPRIRQCLWPAEGVPKLILQVLPTPVELKKAIDMGKGYRLLEIKGLGFEAVAAIQEANPQYQTKEGVAILGVRKGDYILSLSPVKLEIHEGSARFETLKQLTARAAQGL